MESVYLMSILLFVFSPLQVHADIAPGPQIVPPSYSVSFLLPLVAAAAAVLLFLFFRRKK